MTDMSNAYKTEIHVNGVEKQYDISTEQFEIKDFPKDDEHYCFTIYLDSDNRDAFMFIPKHWVGNAMCEFHNNKNEIMAFIWTLEQSNLQADREKLVSFVKGKISNGIESLQEIILYVR